MAAIGSLVFCTDCGNLLETNTAKRAYIVCDICGTSNKDTSTKTITTVSKPNAFPSTLRTRLRSDVAEMSDDIGPTRATIQKSCEKCDAKEVRFYELQLRSADEGSTIFYECPKCNHSWNENN